MRNKKKINGAIVGTADPRYSSAIIAAVVKIKIKMFKSY